MRLLNQVQLLRAGDKTMVIPWDTNKMDQPRMDQSYNAMLFVGIPTIKLLMALREEPLQLVFSSFFPQQEPVRIFLALPDIPSLRFYSEARKWTHQ
ncbi:hypothetical protein PoB_002291800 [Plakobranchus ocellatus]|uniref:Uncharacterized protein n=1 Tax=Plakobranchus ocellatus TaxID=259542 RepID=A0AAV3ZPM6_9GAST|nr:hypothetical protein PoB_002291800 [Plakobranchus ocellatus]